MKSSDYRTIRLAGGTLLAASAALMLAIAPASAQQQPPPAKPKPEATRPVAPPQPDAPPPGEMRPMQPGQGPGMMGGMGRGMGMGQGVRPMRDARRMRQMMRMRMMGQRRMMRAQRMRPFIGQGMGPMSGGRAFAMGRRPMAGRMTGQPRGVLGGIQLDDAQRTRVRDINQKHQAQMRALGDKLREARQALRQTQAADTLDEAAIRKQAAAAASAEADIAIERGRLRTELLGVLTPDQQKTVKERRQRAAAPKKDGGEWR